MQPKNGPGSELHNKVQKLSLDGLTLAEIAKEMGFSVIRTRHILEWEKYQSRAKLGRAVKRGRIIKPLQCQQCGEVKQLQGHHADHSKPLEVTWLCCDCHVKIPRGPYRPYRHKNGPKPVPIVAHLITQAKRVTDEWKDGSVNKTSMEKLVKATEKAEAVAHWCSGIVINE